MMPRIYFGGGGLPGCKALSSELACSEAEEMRLQVADEGPNEHFHPETSGFPKSAS